MSAGQTAGPAGADPTGVQAWRAMRDASDLQFTPAAPWQPAPPPPWAQSLGQWLEHVFAPVARLFGAAWPWVEKGLIAVLALAVLWLGWVLLAPALRRRRGVEPEGEMAWAPPGEEAVALLRDAERLAAEGDFAGATHLLLRRSVAQLSAARPGLVHPASTAREIAAMPTLPRNARTAFATMAGRVEESRYALRALAQGDWLAAREAYAAFANIGLTQVTP